MIDQILCNSGNRTQGLCNTITGSNNLVSGDVLYSTYGYLLTAWAGYLFLATYAAAAVILLALGIWRRQPWTLATVFLGAAIDAIGWGGRVWARSGVFWDQNEGGSYQYDFSSFLMQIICLVIGPVFYSAANYILLGKLVQLTGARYCSLTPKSFSILFCTYDFICLVVQAAGGAMAGIADTTAGANQGAYVMSAGVIIQLVVTLAFVLLLAEYTWRYSKDRPVKRQFHPLPNWRFLARPQDPGSQLAYNELNSPTPVHHRSDIEMRGRGKREANPAIGGRVEHSLGSRGVWILIGLLIVGTGLIIGRSIFRSIELLGGWAGRIAEDEPLFLVLDALLMVLFAWIWVFVFPGFILPPRAR